MMANPREGVLLISPYPDLTAFGLRSISAFLQARGVPVTLLFLRDPDDLLLSESMESPKYPDQVVARVAALAQDKVYIGISLMDCFFHKVKDLTVRLRRQVATPVVWGGIFPHVAWRESSRFADYVVVGDGEEVSWLLYQHLQQRELTEEDLQTGPWRNLVFRRNNHICSSRDLYVAEADLNALPVPDVSLAGKLVYHKQARTLEPLTEAVFYRIQLASPLYGIEGKTYYQTLASRGCPHACTYCCNDFLKRRTKGPYLRFRRPEHIMRELRAAMAVYPDSQYIVFSDDAFSCMPKQAMEQFGAAYKQDIARPFRCLVSPATLTEDKLRLLIDMGLQSVQMGIQSAAPETLRMYRRAGGLPAVRRATSLLHAYKQHLDPPLYDIILENPLETTKDRLQTLRFLLRLPRPFRLQLFSLVLFPETELHRHITARCGIAQQTHDSYNRQFFALETNYVNLLFILLRHNAPRALLRIMSWTPLVGVFNNAFCTFWLTRARLLARGISSRIKGKPA